MTAQHHLRPTPQQAIDALATLLFLPIAAISVLGLYSRGWLAAVLVVSLPLIWYLKTAIINPLRRSQPIERPDLNALLNDPRIRFRVGGGVATCAVDLWFRKYIIFNAVDLNGHYGDWKALIHHEYAHLKYGDAKYFHIVGIFGGIAFTSLAYWVAMAVIISFFHAIDETLATGGSLIGSFVIFVCLVLLFSFFLFWIRQSLHAREFAADREAMNLNSKAFSDWIRRRSNKERHEAANLLMARETIALFMSKGGFTAWLLMQLGKLVRWFTHPSFVDREAVARGGKKPQNFSYVSEILRSMVFLYGGGLLSYFVFQSIFYYLGSDVRIHIFFAAFIIVMIIMPFAAACGAISVSAMCSYDNGGAKSLGIFGLAIAVLNFKILYTIFKLSVVFGYYDQITSGLPPAPEVEISDGTFAFFVIMLNFGVSLILLSAIAWRLLRSRRYNILLHTFIGAISVLAAFLITKVQWAIFM